LRENRQSVRREKNREKELERRISKKGRFSLEKLKRESRLKLRV